MRGQIRALVQIFLTAGKLPAHHGLQGLPGQDSEDRKTVTRRLTPEQLAAWQPLFDNARKMRDLLARIQDLTLQAVDTDDT
jgi:hypothetical protein